MELNRPGWDKRPPHPPAMVADWALGFMLKPVSPPPRTIGSSTPRTVINGRVPDWLHDDMATLARVPEGGAGTPYKGRDDAFNSLGFNAATDPSVDRHMLRQSLIGAAMINRLLAEEGADKIDKKIDRIFADADAKMRPRSPRFEDIPDLPEFRSPDVPRFEPPDRVGDGAHGAHNGHERDNRHDKGSPNDGDRIDSVEAEILDRLVKLRIDREARRRLDSEDRPQVIVPPVKDLRTLLAEPDTPINYRIDAVAPENARIMCSAQYKAGKTTLVGNLIRSLADGDPFLGRFIVHVPAYHIVLIDNEMSLNTLRRWLRDQKINTVSAVADVVALRGKTAAFDLLDDRRRAQWATRLRDVGCDYLLFDCLRPVLDAVGLSEDKDAGKFLTAYDALLDEAGITDTTIVQHMGHANERARGDSRLQDWPDAIWRIVRETDEPDSDRFFTAYGRDVSLPEGKLSFDPDTRRLTYIPGNRGDAQAEAARVAVVELLAHREGGEPMNYNAIESALIDEYTRKAIGGGIRMAIRDEQVTVKDGPRKSKLHRIAYPCSVCGMPVTSKRERHESCHPDPTAPSGGLF